MRGGAAVEDPLAVGAGCAVGRPGVGLKRHLVQRSNQRGLVPLRRRACQARGCRVDGEGERCSRSARRGAEDARRGPRLEGASHRWSGWCRRAWSGGPGTARVAAGRANGERGRSAGVLLAASRGRRGAGRRGTVEPKRGWVEVGRRRWVEVGGRRRLWHLGERRGRVRLLVGLSHQGVVGDDTRLATEALLLQLQEGAELDEGGEAAARHVGNVMLKAVIEAAEDVADEVTVLDAGAQIAEGVRHALHLGGVLDDGEVTLVAAVEFVAEEGDARVAVVAEDAADGAPEGEGGGVPGLHDL